MVYEEYAPSPDVRVAVSAFWRFELEPRDDDATEHVIPPDGLVSVAIRVTADGPPRIVVVGPRLTALRVMVCRGARYVGLRCAPAGGGALLGILPATIRHQVIPLEQLAPGRAADLAGDAPASLPSRDIVERLRSRVASWVCGAPAPDAAVIAMADRVVAARGDLPVATLGAQAGLGYRQALRRFQRAVGLSPKEFARLVRLRQACLRSLEASRPSWVAISAESGFADQSHMGREFTDVYGWPPELVREYLRRIEHVRVLD